DLKQLRRGHGGGNDRPHSCNRIVEAERVHHSDLQQSSYVTHSLEAIEVVRALQGAFSLAALAPKLARLVGRFGVVGVVPEAERLVAQWRVATAVAALLDAGTDAGEYQ